jgi:hypothetical protein
MQGTEYQGHGKRGCSPGKGKARQPCLSKGKSKVNLGQSIARPNQRKSKEREGIAKALANQGTGKASE